MLGHRSRRPDACSRMNLVESSLHCRAQWPRSNFRPHVQRHSSGIPLIGAEEDHRPGFFTERSMPHIAHDADDLHAGISMLVSEGAADGVSLPELPRHRFVHHCDPRRAFPIERRELPALDHRNTHERKVVRTDNVDVGRYRNFGSSVIDHDLC
jgi:hypothetical protein